MSNVRSGFYSRIHASSETNIEYAQLGAVLFSVVKDAPNDEVTYAVKIATKADQTPKKGHRCTLKSPLQV
jgi:hypothetical protein